MRGEWALRRVLYRLDGYLEAQSFQLPDAPALNRLFILAEEVIHAEIMIGFLFFQDMVGNHQNRVAHSNDGLLFADVPHQSVELRRQVRVVFPHGWWPTAMTAFFLPMCPTSRWNCAARYESFSRTAAQAAWVNAGRRQIGRAPRR